MRLTTVIRDNDRTAGLIFNDTKAAQADAQERTALAAPGINLHAFKIPRRFHRAFKVYREDFICGNLRYGNWELMQFHAGTSTRLPTHPR